MKKIIQKKSAILVFALLLCLLITSCGAPAPSGMFHPTDAEDYVNGVENFSISVPEGYTVTMSSNMLAAVAEGSSFSVQTRHSDYYYQGGLEENYKELKSQLTALYGEYTEKKTADLTVADQPALRVEYELTVANVACGYIQYLFYKDTSVFYLFTYSFTPGTADEALLKSVLETITFDAATPKVPEGFRAVQNAEADKLTNDRYFLYCPDEWVFDTSLGQVYMRVPSSTIISNISFVEVKLDGTFADYAAAYAQKTAPELDWGEGKIESMERYILATLYQMSGTLPEFKIHTLNLEEEEESEEEALTYEEIAKDKLLSKKDSILQTFTNDYDVHFTYVDFTATLSDHKAHGSGGLFETGAAEEEKDDTLPTAQYAFRQYFTVKDGYLYFFTYTTSLDQFENQKEDMEKVLKNFEFVEKE
ncbi:MAG: hypothetical protein IJ344_02200 [Clostridia bacterium]|nr:hypothetical protein [Clostridia bacterium]